MSLRRSLALTAAGVLVITLAPGLSTATAADTKPSPAVKLKAETATKVGGEKGTVLDLGKASAGKQLYIVRLDAPAVPTREEAGKGQGAGLSEDAYRGLLRRQQSDLVSSIAGITGGTPTVRYRYTEAINGIAVELTRAEALKVSRVDGVAAVVVDFKRQLQTDRGPEWIGADTIWDGSNDPAGVGSKGEGVVVGILDTGINPANPSFADVGGDGFDHTNPLGSGTYLGVCATDATWGCNDKLIGYWNFSGSEKYDDDGHGSHTASTAAGNVTDATTYSAKGTDFEFSATRTIKGVAPHANIVAYDVCDGAGCQGSSILAALDQVIDDEVDVINYSIGSDDAGSPWVDLDSIGFLNVRAAGIGVANSAGNNGPGDDTVGSPASSPWLMATGATTHDRQWQAEVQDLTADGGATLPDIAGVGFSKATDASYPLVYVTANALCLAGGFTPGQLAGKIVVCDRGTNGRVEKGEVAAAAGAEGMILVNDAGNGDSTNADAHALPAVHISFSAGQALKTWMAANTGEQASLSGGLEHIGDDVADTMAAFSSRGENRAISTIVPSLSAPGVDILAAAGTDNSVEWHFISGTSMASPHAAGALALLKAVQPDWTPAEAQSALMTTAITDIADSDGTDAEWFDMGSGRIDLTQAAKAGLVLDESEADYLAADPSEGGDPRTLNLASMADNACLSSCSWTRTVTGTSTGVGTWTASVSSDSPDLSLSLGSSSFALTDGGTANITVDAEVDGDAPTDTWLNGVLTLTPPSGSDAPEAHLPIAVLPSSAVLPTAIDITTRRDAGSQNTSGFKSVAISELQVSASGLVPEQRQQLSIAEDTTNGDPFDGNGTVVKHFTVGAGAVRFLARLENATAPDFDMYVGTGAVSEDNLVDYSATGGSAESVEIANPAAGDWWVLVQNWEASTAGGTDTADLVSAVVGGDEGNLSAQGPSGAVPAAEPFSVRTFWDEPELDPRETWQGALTLGSGPGSPDDIGVVPVTVHRVPDDVTKKADKTTAAPGETITYTVAVEPNVTPEDQVHTITDTLPAGTTYVPGSATGGATYANGKITWTGESPTPVGSVGSYAFTTPATDPSCVNPIDGGTSYFDLGGIGIDPNPGVTGDTTLFTAFGSMSFGLYGETHTGLSFNDDGYLVYDNASWAGSDEPWTPQSLPDPEDPNSLAALLWHDMEFVYDAPSGAGVSLASGGGLAVVQYNKMRQYGADGSATYDFQVIAENGSNDLVVAYDNLTGPLSPAGGITIGTESAGGTSGSALVNQAGAAGAISDGLVVCMTHELDNFDPKSFTYQVTVNAGVANGTVLTNKAEHVTDNPGAKPAVASASVTVAGGTTNPPQPPTKVASTLTLSAPKKIQVGDKAKVKVKVTAPGVTPTGKVTLKVKAGKKTKTYTATLNGQGKATITLKKAKEKGKLKVDASFPGDTATLPSDAKVTIKVKKKKNHKKH